MAIEALEKSARKVRGLGLSRHGPDVTRERKGRAISPPGDAPLLTGGVVQQFGYFRHLSSAQAECLARRIRIFTVDKGAEIMSDGAPGTCMYLLLRGQIEVSKRLYLTDAEGLHQGSRTIVRWETPHARTGARPSRSADVLAVQGYFAFGEMALLDPNSRRSVAVTALTECTIGELDYVDFMALAEADTDLGLHVVRAIARKLSRDLHQANEDVLNLTTALSFALQG